jgi:hypothetical protein
MNPLKAIYQLLINDATITDEVGLKVFPQKAPQNTANPCIITNFISTSPTNTKDDRSVLDVVTISVDVYHDRNDEAYRISDLVRTALDRKTYNSGGLDVKKVTFIDSMGFTDPMADTYRVNQIYTLRINKQ